MEKVIAEKQFVYLAIWVDLLLGEDNLHYFSYLCRLRNKIYDTAHYSFKELFPKPPHTKLLWFFLLFKLTLFSEDNYVY